MRNAMQGKQECKAMIGGLTQAMQAQNVLMNAAIRSEVIGADASELRAGCGYGITYPCAYEAQVRRLLRNAGIRIRHKGVQE